MNHQDMPDRQPEERPDAAAQDGQRRPVPPKPAAPPTTNLPHTAPAGPLQPSGRTSRSAFRKPRRAGRTVLTAAFALLILGVVGSLVWLAVWLTSSGQNTGSGDKGTTGVVETSPTPLATPLPLPREGVAPPDFRLGDCFKDFQPEALKSTIVACDTAHSAQLVAIYRYPASDSYPGADALKAKALEACQAAKLAPAANDYTLNFERTYPSSSSWDSGDRRVDCYVTADGNAINASVLP